MSGLTRVHSVATVRDDAAGGPLRPRGRHWRIWRVEPRESLLRLELSTRRLGSREGDRVDVQVAWTIGRWIYRHSVMDSGDGVAVDDLVGHTLARNRLGVCRQERCASTR